MDFAVTLTDLLILLGTGAFAGVLAGLFGIGGGVVLVPGLLYVFTAQGYDYNVMHMAVGTSLAIIVPTGYASARAHWKKGAFNKQAFKNWAPGIVIGVGAGTYLASLLDGEALKAIFAIAICFLALLMQFDPPKLKAIIARIKRQAVQKPAAKPDDAPPRLTVVPPSMRILSSCGVLVGTLSSLMGIGGATMTVPTMSILGMHIRESVATASAIGVLIAIPAALGFMLIGGDGAAAAKMVAEGMTEKPLYIIGYVNFLAVALILPSSILFTKLGVGLAHALPFKNLKQIFSLFMVIVALRMLWSVYGPQ